ncbi:hypothetical protein JNUCC0626_48330 [Lentzea sp. JNUCC 0626]|uniref:hypothetical protein n=1 Tax=Lentzea sp. JNUCC 0626 TaxID=3367513 RepID=UPI00374856EC
MSDPQRAREAKRRSRYTGESFQRARLELEQLGEGQNRIPDAHDAVQQQVESAALNRLLHGAHRRWPTDLSPAHLLVHRVGIPIDERTPPRCSRRRVANFSAALALQLPRNLVRPVDEIFIHRVSFSTLLVTDGSSSSSAVHLQCSWTGLCTSIHLRAQLLNQPRTRLHLKASKGFQLAPADRAVLSGLLRRIALFAVSSAPDWLFTWHKWTLAGRGDTGPAVPEHLAALLADESFGLYLTALRTLGIGRASRHRTVPGLEDRLGLQP